ncbi:TadE/TadG family type IV pilus assembly protein [Nocardioides aestuarii]|uniref:TadE/TadG family type IV pilus assembly protein n=1 Tax=Nocardioides aestuarii TaxID=252231 RepID=A0ABW4TI70_9ACTN
MTVLLRRRADRGASAVEFALVLPFLLLLVFGLIQYGLYFWALQGGSDLARGAARLSAVGNANDCTTLTNSVTGTPAAAPGYASTVPTVTRTYTDAETPNAVLGQWEPGDKVTVTVTFTAIDMKFPVPFIQGGTVSQRVDARVERIDGQPTNC